MIRILKDKKIPQYQYHENEDYSVFFRAYGPPPATTPRRKRRYPRLLKRLVDKN
jgi:hypothetical protein